MLLTTVAAIALRLAVAAVLLVPIASPERAMAQEGVRFGTETIAITGGGRVHRFTVELAETPEQQARGLMFRTALAPDAGMLFDYRQPQHVTMWMANTLVSLDMLFVAADGSIVHIAPRTRPESRETIGSGQRVRAVVELLAGTTERLGIKVGDRVLSPRFGTAP